MKSTSEPTLVDGPGRSPRHDVIWRAPSTSKASRRPAMRSRGSVRGHIVNPRTRREVVYESILERDLAYMLIANPQVRAFQEQPQPVTFLEKGGRLRSHTFDFHVELVDDTSRAIAVKPKARVERSGIEGTLALIRQQRRGFAHGFDLRTGDHITRARVHDARLITWALRKRDNQDVSTMAEVAKTLRGSAAISSLLATSADEARAFVAVLCLIADGVLRHVGKERLSRASSVERVSAVQV